MLRRAQDSFGRKVTVLRAFAQLSTECLAELAGIGAVTLNRIERGARPVRPAESRRILGSLITALSESKRRR